MAKDFSKGRGIYTDHIRIKYAQLPPRIYELLYLKYGTMSETDRALAILHFVYHYYTNEGYESLKTKNANAYMLCDIMNEATFSVQNNARWKCFDEFYEGNKDLDYDAALDNYNKKLKEKKKEDNRRQYQKRKQENIDLEKEHEEGKENLKKAAKQHGIEYTDEDFDY